MARKRELVIDELAQVKNVGPKLAEVLYESLRIRSLEELARAADDGRLVDLSGVGARRADQIREALQEHIGRTGESGNGPGNGRGRRQEGRSGGSSATNGARAANGQPKGRSSAGPQAQAQARRAERAANLGPTSIPVTRPTTRSASVEPITPGSRERVQMELYTRFLNALRCPVCGNDTVGGVLGALQCRSCHRQFAYQNGLADLAPPEVPDASLMQRIMDMRVYAKFYEETLRPMATRRLVGRSMQQEYELSTDWLDINPQVRLVDVGCGPADFTRHFARIAGLPPVTDSGNGTRRVAPPLVVGVDLSRPMLEMARQAMERENLEQMVFLVRADATRLPLRRASFNRLHCAWALHLMRDPDEALRNFARVLEPGSLAFISTFTLGQGVARTLAKRLMEIPTGFHWFSRNELQRRAERAGFELLQERTTEDSVAMQLRRI